MDTGYIPDSPEQWRPIPGFPNYIVSDQGRVASVAWTPTPRLLSPSPRGADGSGYLRVSLRREGRTYGEDVHRLVAHAFIGPRPEGMETRHLDGDRFNNAAGNLRYGTVSENARDRVNHGRDAQARKKTCVRGHAYDDLNTYVAPTGWRQCRPCKRLRDQSRALTAANIRRASAA